MSQTYNAFWLGAAVCVVMESAPKIKGASIPISEAAVKHSEAKVSPRIPPFFLKAAVGREQGNWSLRILLSLSLSTRTLSGGLIEGC